jgi:hypothetical protein
VGPGNFSVGVRGFGIPTATSTSLMGTQRGAVRRLRADVIRSVLFTEKRIYGIHHGASESRVAQEAEAEAQDRVEVVADAEHGAQGEANGVRGKAGGGNRAITHPEKRSGCCQQPLPVELRLNDHFLKSCSNSEVGPTHPYRTLGRGLDFGASPSSRRAFNVGSR